jgi:hypothetical protein
VDPEKRQDDGEIDGGESGVDERYAHLRKNHAPECIAESLRLHRDGVGKRALCRAVDGFAQREHCADDHADQDMRQYPRRLGAREPHFARVLVQPLGERFAQLVGAFGHVFHEPRGQRAARAFDDLRHLVQQPGKAPGVAAQECDHSDDRRGENADDQRGEDADGDELWKAARQAPLQLGRDHVDELEHEQPREQRRQDMEAQDEEERDSHEDPRGVFDCVGPTSVYAGIRHR